MGTMSYLRKIRQVSIARAQYMLSVTGPEGQKIQYVTQQNQTLTLFCTVPGTGKTNMREVQDTRTQEEERRFKIALQPLGNPTFPANGGPWIDEQVIDENGDTWAVRSWTNDDGVGAVYILTTVKTTPRQVGDVGQ